MTARIGILCTDGSILLLPEGTDIDEAKKEAEEHDWGAPGPRTRVVKFNIEIIGNYSGPGHGITAAGGAAITSWIA